MTKEFISEGVATGDVNGDGKMDIMAGTFWFEAPHWIPHEIAKGLRFSPDTAFSNSFLDFSMDVDQDGWIDLIRVGFPGQELVWYENPRNKPGYWIMHTISNHIGNESPAFVDIDGDGRPDILCNDPVEKKVVWYKSPSAKGDTVWKKYIVSSDPDLATNIYTHGLGFGDINNDGRPDVIITKGWWESPKDPTQSDWIFHPADLGEDCSQMYAFDVNDDGYTDVISASAHHYGIWWHQQKKDSNGKIVFETHEICKLFSQSHGLALADINGDGHPDLVTGKRYFAHNGKDPGAFDPAVLYWFEFRPGKSPQWISHLIDNNSGVGLQVVVNDINKDGLPDIVVANKKGVFIFERVKN
ncbi:MAG TPA: VCBS repeat-containing protein [Puia sp.]|nr:VCBS repeat-containing protein [Puia sp.]